MGTRSFWATWPSFRRIDDGRSCRTSSRTCVTVTYEAAPQRRPGWVGRRSYAETVTEFEYQPEDGVLILWVLTVSGYDDQIDGDWDEALDTLSDVEHVIENLEDEYRDETGAALVRVHGAHGWREFEWDNSALHPYEWNHALLDMRCSRCKSPDNDLYMVTDEIWASSGFGSGIDGRVCFRCLEKAIGRLLVPSDFKPGLPANDGHHHGPELRQRMGYT